MKDEFSFILGFARVANGCDRATLDQLRALWTAYCLHWGLPVGCSKYTQGLAALKNLIATGDLNDPPEDFAHVEANFEGFMGELL